jgi:hypothetical protein
MIFLGIVAALAVIYGFAWCCFYGFHALLDLFVIVTEKFSYVFDALPGLTLASVGVYLLVSLGGIIGALGIGLIIWGIAIMWVNVTRGPFK